ncbi:MAG: acyltransferase [Chryseosolibacter sp.]
MNKAFYRNFSFSNTTFPFVFKLPESLASKKNANVETLRGLAIILVVLGHMIGYTSTGGMRVSDDSVFRYLYYSLEYVRLPLFTVISGWVYANKPVLATNQVRFIKGKLRRLIIPMFVISTLLFLFRMVIPGTNTTPELHNLPRNLIFPYDVYWYLFSLFIIFVTITILDTKPFFHKLEGWFITLVGAFVFLFISENLLDPVPNFFSFKGAAYLFPFFLAGIGIYRYKDFLLNDKMTVLTLLVFIASVTVQQMVWFGYFPVQEKHSILGMTVGISGVLLLFRLKLKNQLLIWIGAYAYGIFLFHVFFTGGIRIVLLRLGLENQVVILVLGVLGAIFFSILAEMIVKRSTVLRFLFLGLKKNEQ